MEIHTQAHAVCTPHNIVLCRVYGRTVCWASHSSCKIYIMINVLIKMREKLYVEERRRRRRRTIGGTEKEKEYENEQPTSTKVIRLMDYKFKYTQNPKNK